MRFVHAVVHVHASCACAALADLEGPPPRRPTAPSNPTHAVPPPGGATPLPELSTGLLTPEGAEPPPEKWLTPLADLAGSWAVGFGWRPLWLDTARPASQPVAGVCGSTHQQQHIRIWQGAHIAAYTQLVAFTSRHHPNPPTAAADPQEQLAQPVHVCGAPGPGGRGAGLGAHDHVHAGEGPLAPSDRNDFGAAAEDPDPLSSIQPAPLPPTFIQQPPLSTINRHPTPRTSSPSCPWRCCWAASPKTWRCGWGRSSGACSTRALAT
jgi:hypothetical protein